MLPDVDEAHDLYAAAFIDDIPALCGGCSSRAAGHFYLAAAWAAGDELDLLETSDRLQANSRLSCQIEVVDELDRLAVTIALED